MLEASFQRAFSLFTWQTAYRMQKGMGRDAAAQIPLLQSRTQSPEGVQGPARSRGDNVIAQRPLHPQRLPQNNAAEEIAGFYGCIFLKPSDKHRDSSTDDAAVPLTPSGRTPPLHPALKLLLRWASFSELLKTLSSARAQSGADTEPRGKTRMACLKMGL